MLKEMLPEAWSKVLSEFINSKEFVELDKFVHASYSNKTIYPAKENIFRAFELTSYKDTKVVILAQDPYHGENQANGLAFSVNKGVKLPPSLRNIYKELSSDLGVDSPLSGDLSNWAKQGILMLNTVMTVEKGQANSHKGIGWENFTDYVIEKLNDKAEPVLFILWGNSAQEKEKLLDLNKHSVLKAPHPSPLSAYRGFFGSKPFSKANQWLKDNNYQEIDWVL